ncbi:Chromosome partition protein Smc [Planctomycetes bacterium Pan216]|uniref:Chromosome partition protein Smc n=1 Tax=Kolteria novifilia TaxID=2527975 RepID=A0A518B528_9BACT|nr:Chromosome partition protein Smc [Planctomycetes bacterium Pan216]
MLKWLQLVGFKSFADKTRFGFGDGVTGIVGPNGSGKSNVVDAIRWILGEQSAKSLRGKEMADVIFNGSSTRRSLGLGEVSLCLDNSRRYLPVESDEVVLTRRVYRSGEGEYLINNRLARLRDIRELFLGTGAGASTYCIIEQGKVERMLQASTKDRRQIFEEAAGTSRFRAKKIECLRRLDRVEQNLVRAQDIWEEVDKQLRGLRSQAGKARRYKEMSDRLRELRLQVGAANFYEQSRELKAIEDQLGGADEETTKSEERLKESQRRFRELDETLTGQEEAIREVTERLSAVREQTATLESAVASDRSRHEELSAETNDGFLQLRSLRLRANQARVEHRQHREQVATETTRRGEAAEELQRLQQEAKQRSQELEQATKRLEEDRAKSDEVIKRLARFENEQSAIESQLAILWQQSERLAEKYADYDTGIRRLQREQTLLRPQALAVEAQVGRLRNQGGTLRRDHKRLLEQRSDLLDRLAHLRDRRTALSSRAEVLENLAVRHEGFEGGVRQALNRKAAGQEIWRPVLGVLAECLEVDSDHADLVELALGPRAQALIVRSTEELSDELLHAARELNGRVPFLLIDDGSGDHLDVFPDEMDALCLADLIRCADELRPLVERLLGTTFVADDLASARDAASRFADLRFITPQGDLLEPGGCLSVGPLHRSQGLLLRAAERREIKGDIEKTEEEIRVEEVALARLDASIDEMESTLSLQDVLESTLSEQARHFASVLGRNVDRCQELSRSRKAAARERAENDRELDQVNQQSDDVEKRIAESHDQLAAFSSGMSRTEQGVEELRAQMAELNATISDRKLEFAKAEQRLASLSAGLDQVAAAEVQRQQELQDHLARLQTARSRGEAVEARLLLNTAALAELYHQKDGIASVNGFDPARVAKMREERRVLSASIESDRTALDQLRSRHHKAELRLTEVRMRRDNLVARLSEDYDIDASTLIGADYEPPTEPLDEARSEIDQLTAKISKLGTVNTAAVEQLDDLEERSGTLRHQLDDLQAAKKHLDSVIARINEESRRLFLDTFETVREHFQDLFRKLFGGGKADLLLEDDADVLEGGIDIIARPPGKEPRSISLLSGGEKTMTAVAMLMALFRSKPSPFCVLDEVDAALDEANIGRFTEMLREFLDQSQFIIVTHSKTTMANTDVLHGVTQREPGISTRVSVRLEDIGQDGRISDEAGAEEEVESAAEESSS